MGGGGRRHKNYECLKNFGSGFLTANFTHYGEFQISYHIVVYRVTQEQDIQPIACTLIK